MSKKMEEFFKKLKEIRRDSDHTQQEIADELGISLKQYQNYEKKTIPPHDKLVKLNEILNFDFSKVLYQEKVPKETKEKKELVEYTPYDGSNNIVSDYKEKYLTALEEIRELQKELLQEKSKNKNTSHQPLKRAK